MQTMNVGDVRRENRGPDHKGGEAVWGATTIIGEFNADPSVYKNMMKQVERGVKETSRPRGTPARYSGPLGCLTPRNSPCPCGSGRKYKKCHRPK